jgi:hypothetical protein
MLSNHSFPLLAFVATTSIVACSAPPVPPADDGGITGGCILPYVGDKNAPMEMDVIALGVGGKLATLSDGSDISLIFPPQGGRVVFAGVRARNVNPCGVRLAGAIRDPLSKQVRIDNRILNLQVTADGYAQSDPGDISAFSNIASCPNQWSAQDMMDLPYELTVTLTDTDDKKVTKVLQVIPRCDEPGEIDGCRCICAADYVLGMVCPGTPTDSGAAGVPNDASGD